MKAVSLFAALAISIVIIVFCSFICFAQQVTGVLGSPNVTTTIGGQQLPPPDPNFGG